MYGRIPLLLNIVINPLPLRGLSRKEEQKEE